MSKVTLNLDYYYGTESESYSFFRIPKILCTDKRFSGISLDAKFLYGLMLDRMGLSMKNGWFDKDNKVYIYFTLEDAVNQLGCSNTKAVKLFSELDTTKGIGLIERKKQGQGKPTIIYVKSFATLDKDIKTSENEKSKENNEVEHMNFDRQNDEKSQENEYILEENKVLEYKKDENSECENLDIDINEVLTSKNEKSRNAELRIQDFQKTDTNNTYNSNTDISYTESINLSINQEPNKITDGLIDRVCNADLENLVYDEIEKEQTLPFSYINDIEKMTAAIYLLSDFHSYKCNAEQNSECEFEFSIVNLFAEALIEMLTTKRNMTLKGATVTYSKVYDKLITFIDFSGGIPSIYNLLEITKRDFIIACEQFEIKNYLQYMKSCVWNAMQVRDIDVQAFTKRYSNSDRVQGYVEK